MSESSDHFNCRSCITLKCKLKTLTNSELLVLKDSSYTINVVADTLLFVQNTPPTHIIYIKKGMVQLNSQLSTKRKKILNIYNEDSFLGIPSALSQKIHMYSAKTLCYSELCYISISFFKHLLHNNASFAYQVLINISEESLQMHKQMQANYELHLPGKIAKALLYFSESIYDSSNFNLPFSKSEFANYIGASRERVSKILNQFTYDKIIEMQGRQIKINNMNLLQKLSKIG